MRNLIIVTFAAASLLAAASVAKAGSWWNGAYFPPCHMIQGMIPGCGLSD
jgi:hypothetical protein